MGGVVGRDGVEPEERARFVVTTGGRVVLHHGPVVGADALAQLTVA